MAKNIEEVLHSDTNKDEQKKNKRKNKHDYNFQELRDMISIQNGRKNFYQLLTADGHLESIMNLNS